MGSRQIHHNPAYFHNALLSNPTIFGHCLKEIKFPADKKQLLSFAKENGAPASVVYILRKFSDRKYRNVVDLFKEFWKIV